MNTLRAIAPFATVLAVAVVGCMDPSVYHSSGSAPRPAGTARQRTPAASRTNPRDKANGDIRVAAPGADLLAPSPHNVGISIEKLGTDPGTEAQASVAFRYSNDNIVVKSPRGRLAHRNGIRIGVGGPNLRVWLDASAKKSNRISRDVMFVTVLSGHEGQIHVGYDTYVERLGYWTPHGYRVLVEKAVIGRSLAVRPTILKGGMVAVEVWPRFTSRRRRGAIDVTELATKVVVRDGQPIVIGGMASMHQDVGGVLFGIGGERRTRTMSIVLTPKIGGGGIDWPKGRW